MSFVGSRCVYSGASLPKSKLSEEHVLPKSLGGCGSLKINASKHLNNLFGTQIDGKIAKDIFVLFKRRDLDLLGHSKKAPTPIWRNLATFEKGMGVENLFGPYICSFEKSGPRIIHQRTRKPAPKEIFPGKALAVHLDIDHVARLKFCLKTLLGVGWVVWDDKIERAVDIEFVRRTLIEDVYIAETIGLGGLGYSDEILDPDSAKLAHIKKSLLFENMNTFLLEVMEGELRWSVAVLGILLGSITLPLMPAHNALGFEVGNRWLIVCDKHSHSVATI